MSGKTPPCLGFDILAQADLQGNAHSVRIPPAVTDVQPTLGAEDSQPEVVPVASASSARVNCPERAVGELD